MAINSAEKKTFQGELHPRAVLSMCVKTKFGEAEKKVHARTLKLESDLFPWHGGVVRSLGSN